MDAKAVVDALFNGSVIALVAAAATMVLDLFGFLNLAIPAAFVAGAAGAFAFAAVAAPEWQWIAAGALIGAIVGATFDRAALDPLRRRGRNAAMLPASVGAALVIFGLMRVALYPGPSAMPRPVLLGRMASIGPATFTELQAIALILAIGSCALLHLAIRKTRFGNGVRATNENALAAQLMGIRIDRVPTAAMAAAGAMSAVAGALVAMHSGRFEFAMPVNSLLWVLAALALAPAGSIGGVCVAAYLLSFVAALLAAHFPWLPPFAFTTLQAACIVLGLAWRHNRADADASAVGYAP